MTPKRVRSAVPTLVAGAADHKSRKRYGAKSARHRSAEYISSTEDVDYTELFTHAIERNSG